MTALVTTTWLAEHLSDPDLVILDASAHLPDANRDASAEYLTAHVPGARFLDLKALGPTAEAPLGSDAHRQSVAARLGAVGLDGDERIVLYDDSKLKSSARAWFILRLYGVEPYAILDGGLASWRGEGRPLETGGAAFTPTEIALGHGAGDIRTKREILANLDSKAEQLVDARDAARFTGETQDFRPGVAAGHIPGSANLPFGALLGEDGTFRSPDEIRAAFASAGVDLSQPVTTSCGSGVTASVLLFALDLIGKTDTALYDGSWSEWGADPDTPKATGA